MGGLGSEHLACRGEAALRARYVGIKRTNAVKRKHKPMHPLHRPPRLGVSSFYLVPAVDTRVPSADLTWALRDRQRRAACWRTKCQPRKPGVPVSVPVAVRVSSSQYVTPSNPSTQAGWRASARPGPARRAPEWRSAPAPPPRPPCPGRHAAPAAQGVQGHATVLRRLGPQGFRRYDAGAAVASAAIARMSSALGLSHNSPMARWP